MRCEDAVSSHSLPLYCVVVLILAKALPQTISIQVAHRQRFASPSPVLIHFVWTSCSVSKWRAAQRDQKAIVACSFAPCLVSFDFF